MWIPLFSWTSIEFHYFCGHAAVISTNFVDKHWIPLFSWTRYSDFHYFLEKPASSAVNVHFFCGIQKSFPTRTTTTTTTTNKPFLRPRQRSLAVKNCKFYRIQFHSLIKRSLDKQILSFMFWSESMMIEFSWALQWKKPWYVSLQVTLKTLTEVCSPYLCASFGTFCVQLGKFFAFAAQ